MAFFDDLISLTAERLEACIDSAFAVVLFEVLDALGAVDAGLSHALPEWLIACILCRLR